jgi:hypothetical protein
MVSEIVPIPHLCFGNSATDNFYLLTKIGTGGVQPPHEQPTSGNDLKILSRLPEFGQLTITPNNLIN